MPSVTTMVKDASERGGGTAAVACNLHGHLLRATGKAFLVTGTEPAQATANAWVSGWSGQRLHRTPTEALADVVHIHGLWTPFEYRAWRLAQRRGAHIAFSPHGALEPWAMNHKSWKKSIAWRFYQKRMLDSADLIVVNSVEEKRRLRQLRLDPPIAVIPNAVDRDGLDSGSILAPRERIVLYFSRIDPKKGVLDLVDAWSGIEHKNGYRLHIRGYGDPHYVSQVRQRIASLSQDDISLLPPLFGASRWQAFLDASVYVLPSYSENFGLTVAEALTAGLPVITTRSTPWHHLQTEGLGWIVDNDVRQLRSALEAVLAQNPQSLQALRVKASAHSAARYSWSAVTKTYLETYSWMKARDQASPSWIEA